MEVQLSVQQAVVDLVLRPSHNIAGIIFACSLLLDFRRSKNTEVGKTVQRVWDQSDRCLFWCQRHGLLDHLDSLEHRAGPEDVSENTGL